MSEPLSRPSALAIVTLRDVRAYLRRSHCVGLAVLIAVAYALGSMLVGGMLIFARYQGGYGVVLWWGNALGFQPWNYPLLLIEAPWGFIELPFFATLSMIVVSVGVGLGMAVAVVLGYRLVVSRKTSAGRPAASGAIAGLTPAMIALVTLGACCSTTAAATAGVGLVAQASGTSTSNLLYNNWFLGVFQMAVVYVALIAQEMLLRVYGTLFAGSDPGFTAESPTVRPISRRSVLSTVLRAALLVGGVTWVLAVVASWTLTSPTGASAAVWFGWVVEHWLVGGFAIVVALVPRVPLAWARTLGTSGAGTAARVALFVGGWSLGVWVPSPLAGAGVEGFGNELLGLVGAPASFGAVAPAFSWGVALVLRWGFQYLLLAGLALAVALAPNASLQWVANPEDPAVRSSRPESVRVAAPLDFAGRDEHQG